MASGRVAKRPAGRLQPPAAARRAVERRPEVSYLFGRMDRALRRRLSEALRPFKLSIAQYTTLSVLHTRGELSNAQLASRAFISPQAMNEVVQGLEERKLVSRRASASHGRIVQLLLTERGVEAMSACDAAVRQLELVMLAPLTALEKVTLRAALAKCTQILELHDGNGNAS